MTRRCPAARRDWAGKRPLRRLQSRGTVATSRTRNCMCRDHRTGTTPRCVRRRTAPAHRSLRRGSRTQMQPRLKRASPDTPKGLRSPHRMAIRAAQTRAIGTKKWYPARPAGKGFARARIRSPAGRKTVKKSFKIKYLTAFKMPYTTPIFRVTQHGDSLAFSSCQIQRFPHGRTGPPDPRTRSPFADRL